VLPEIHVETASEVATRLILDAIVDGRFPPGTPLRLQDISRQLGMSMMPVREAIRELAAMDIVEMEPRRGARVREKSLADLQDTYFSRELLETTAIRESASRATPDDVERAAAALAEQEDAQRRGDLVGARDAHERFHFALYEASRRGWLVRSILPAWRNSERYRVRALQLAASADERLKEHRAMLAAVVSGNADEAAAALKEHLRHSVDLSMDELQREQESEGEEVAAAANVNAR
jgi:DNA-binding GntR family transcriptional regulator